MTTESSAPSTRPTLPIHVLISSYACDPVAGSEQGVGWNIFRNSLDVAAHTTLVTRSNDIDVIRSALHGTDPARYTLVGFDLPLPLRKLKKRLPGGVQLYYSLWQLRVGAILRRVHNRRPVDVLHHATFAVDWSPCGATRALGPGVRFIWGPVGGATACPAHLLRYMGASGAVVDVLRDLGGRLGRRLYGRPAARHAALTLVQNGDDERYFAPFARRIACEPNAFIDSETLPQRDPAAVDPLLVVGVGRLVGWKGWALAIEMMAELDAEFRLEIYGDGPDRRRLERITAKRGLESRVIFRGRQPRRTVFDAVARAHCVVHPSLHEAAGWSVAESLSIGTPTVCLDLGGPSMMLGESGGTVVNPMSSNLARQLAQAAKLAAPPHDRSRWRSHRLEALLHAWYSECSESATHKVAN